MHRRHWLHTRAHHICSSPALVCDEHNGAMRTSETGSHIGLPVLSIQGPTDGQALEQAKGSLTAERGKIVRHRVMRCSVAIARALLANSAPQPAVPICSLFPATPPLQLCRHMCINASAAQCSDRPRAGVWGPRGGWLGLAVRADPPMTVRRFRRWAFWDRQMVVGTVGPGRGVAGTSGASVASVRQCGKSCGSTMTRAAPRLGSRLLGLARAPASAMLPTPPAPRLLASPDQRMADSSSTAQHRPGQTHGWLLR